MSLSDAEILQRIEALELQQLRLNQEVARLREALRDRHARRPPQPPIIVYEEPLQEIVAAGRFHQSSVRYTIGPLSEISLEEFRVRYTPRIHRFLVDRLLNLHNMKAIMGFTCSMHRETSAGIHRDTATFWSSARRNAVALNRASEIPPMLNTIFAHLIVQIDEHTSMGSGWVFDGLTEVIINTYRHDPLNGRSYIPLPKKIADRKACINIKNEDDNCFLWSLLALASLALWLIKRSLRILKTQSLTQMFSLHDLTSTSRVLRHLSPLTVWIRLRR